MSRVLMVFLATVLIFLGAAAGADLPQAPTPANRAEKGASLESFLNRKADLLLIRAMFNVVSHDEIVLQLGADLQSMGTRGPTEQELSELDDDLLAESNYLVVSLKYLVQVGGAAWPSDRSESSYENDALIELPAIQRQLIDAAQTREDPIELLRKLDAINALTEGYSTMPKSLDHFSDRDTLVQQALAQFNPRVDL